MSWSAKKEWPVSDKPPTPRSATVPDPAEEEVRRQSRRLTRRAFLAGGVAGAMGFAGWTWLRTSKSDGGVPWPLRHVLRLNEGVGRAVFGEDRLAPTFPAGRAAAAEVMRVNGSLGLVSELNVNAWRLQVEGGPGGGRSFTLDEIRALPQTTMVTELKCIEGWSQVISWTGVSLRDFMTHYRLGTRSGAAPDPKRKPDDLFPYVALETPDREYYVGLDRASALHPQTLLCHVMGGQPLTTNHGAPLRLAIPVKYGIKNIKRIGHIRFTDERPRDYWAERGYDWYSGH
jgi:DMSO/TMAO reductase YedYZ molybdopterin-dependent catalytic subunit